jgi:membrane protein implicated in regulation of membrane protease activity
LKAIIMRLVFLIPLTLSLVTGYVYQKSADEMAYLSGVITALLLILSLILAPWQIQIVILIVAIFMAGRFWRSLESGVKSEEPKEVLTSNSGIDDKSMTAVASIPENQKMQKYRGASYESASSLVNATEGEIVGKYRGAPLRASSQPVLTVRPKPQLKYRGASISNQEPAIAQNGGLLEEPAVEVSSTENSPD